MKQTLIIGSETLTQMARQLFFRKEITEKQLYEIERRNSQMPEEKKKNVVVLE